MRTAVLDRRRCPGLIVTELSRGTRSLRVRGHWLGAGIGRVTDDEEPRDACHQASMLQVLDVVRGHALELLRITPWFGMPTRVRTTLPEISPRTSLETWDEGDELRQRVVSCIHPGGFEQVLDSRLIPVEAHVQALRTHARVLIEAWGG